LGDFSQFLTEFSVLGVVSVLGVTSSTFIPFFYKFLSERGFQKLFNLSEIPNSGNVR
jgi:hypothetical protein